MSTFSSSEIFQAMVVCRGNLIGSIRVTGFSSIKALLTHILRSITPAVRGLVTINLRNIDNGWSLSRTVSLA
ncbi:MAG: hypothetical protein NC336_04065 [Clostridium sp.]|nr:hypothetical protein [Clostridium sp.]